MAVIEEAEKRYRELHQAFIKDHNGTTILENFLLISSGPAFVFFNCCIQHFLFSFFTFHLLTTNLLNFILDFSFIIFPLVVNFTVFSNYSAEYLSGILTVYICCIVYFLFFHQVNFDSNRLHSNKIKPFITYFRSIVNIITAICILAVDFNVFPRRLAKAENFGYGLMDTGVGFYIVTNGIVSQRSTIHSNKREIVLKTFLSVIPLVMLGAARFLTTTAIDYQVHTSEYGVHWNFFLTLAAVKFSSSILLLYFNKNLALLALVITTFHQYLLSCGLQDWVISSIPRNNLLTANREGIVSLPGYLSLYFFSMDLGQVLKSISTTKDRCKYFIVFFLLLIALVCLTLWSESYFPNSRRLANTTYVLWILSMSIYIIIICFIFELSLQLFYDVLRSKVHCFIPNILMAINYNGLVFFLTANLLTGLVNICFKTLYVSDVNSVIIITIYMLTTCSVTSLLHYYKVRLKWW